LSKHWKKNQFRY